jgi:hypothetical protein
MAIDIPSLFSDIIESPEQRRTRMLTEGTLLGRELTSGLRGLAATQAPLVSAIAQRLPQQREDIRRGVGGMLGLDVRTQSEKVQDILRQGDTSTPEGMTRLARALQDVAPAQAIQLRQAAASQQAEARAAAAQAELTRLQTLNELADAETRRQTEAARLEADATEQTRLTSLRSGLKDVVRQKLTEYGPSQLLESYEQRIDGGQFDSAADAARLFEELNPEDKLIPYGNNLYNADTGKFIIAPQTDPQTGVIMDPSLKDHDPASISRYFQKVRELRNNTSLSDEERYDQTTAALNILLPIIPEEKYEAVERDGETIYVSVPASAQRRIEKEQELNALNARNLASAEQARAGIAAASRVRTEIEKAKADGKDIIGGFVDVILTGVPASQQYALSTELSTLEGLMALTGLAAARQGSAVGATGFGALNQAELQLLKDRIAALRVGQPYEQFMQNLEVIENTLYNLEQRSSVELTYDQYIGLDPKPEPSIINRSDLSLEE